MNRLMFWFHTIKLLFRGSRLLNIDGRYIIVEFYKDGDSYMASASTASCSVWNCFGPTKKQAQEMALYRLKRAMEMEITGINTDMEDEIKAK